MLIRIITLLLLVGMNLACSKQSHQLPTPVKLKENRRFGFHITETEQGRYDENFQLAKQAGMEVLPFTLIWNHIEPSKDVYNLSVLEIVNGYYPTQGISLCLTVSPIYALDKAVPEDLKALAWNDPEMIERFTNFLSMLKQRLPAVSISFLSLGNEVDLALGVKSDWEPYRQFYEASRLHAKRLWGENLAIGLETTWQGLIRTYPEQLKKLNQQSDYIQVSYYPLTTDFTMKQPESFSTDMDAVLAIYRNRKVVIEETGYATSIFCSGSEEKQKQYIENIFQWWDQHTQTVPFIGFLWLNDLSEERANQFTKEYGIPNNTAFKEYLRTTAFRTWPGKGTDKMGFTQLKAEIKAREW